MIIKFNTPNGKMTIVPRVFFPVSKKKMDKLLKSVVDKETVFPEIAAELKLQIDELEMYAKGSKSRAEIHEMSMKEYLRGSFLYEAESRKVIFYHNEYVKANEVILKLKGNLEALL